jgi:hypothetical protein
MIAILDLRFKGFETLIGAVVLGFLALVLSGCQSPELTWIAPVDGASVWGIVKLEARIAGADAAGVRFYLGEADDGLLIAEGATSDGLTYTADWYTQAFVNGDYQLVVIADVGAGEPLSAASRVGVANQTREALIPADIVKLTPENDPAPPQLNPELAGIWHDPVPLDGPVNSAGAEDSAFITPDGNTLYFWFTPDPAQDVHAQAADPMTGIYWSHKVEGRWSAPQRLYLGYYDQVAMDGAHTIWNDQLWFASVREGNFKDIDYWIAHWSDGRWGNWGNAGELLNVDYQIGELHISADGNELFFDSQRPGGLGGKDIWVTRRTPAGWSSPEPILAVNTEMTEGWPYLTPDGGELWFTRATPGPEIYRSLRVGDGWGPPQLVLSSLAGESSLDAAGNLYFTHHRWDDVHQRVSEADIYVCYRR